MPELEPITREEMLLDGQDLEPITRKEMFIKRIYDKTQVIPEPITREEIFLKKAGDETTDVTIEQLSVSENGTYSEEGVAYSPVIVNVPAPPIPDNAYLLNDLSGLPADIASFTDGASLPMPSLKVGIEPVQDLHGYDAPWVGGAGKNKANIADMNVQSQTTMGRLTLPSGTYVASATVKNNTSIGGAIKINTSLETLALGEIPSASGTSRVSTASFTLSESTEIVVVVSSALSGYNYDVSQVQIELGTTATTFAPYSNICPISGWDECKVTVADDLENPTVSNVYTVDLDGTRYGGKLDVVSGVMTVDRIKTSMSTNWTVNTESSTYWLITNTRSDEISVENTDTSIRVISDGFKGVSANEMITKITTADNINSIALISSKRLFLKVAKADYPTLQDLYSMIQTNNIQVVYELATPLTIQLTPTAVKSLDGENNVFASTGDVEELEYFSKEV